MRLQTLVFVSTRNMYYVIFVYYDIAIVPTVWMYMYVIYILNKQSIYLHNVYEGLDEGGPEFGIQ